MSRLNHSRGSITSQSGAAKTFEENIIRQSTESTWKSYGSFMSKFNSVYDSIHDSNLKYINSSTINYPAFTNCIISDDLVENTTIYDLCSTCGNMELNKVVIVFSQLVLTMDELTSITKEQFIDPIVIYGQEINKDGHDDATNEEDGQTDDEGNDFIEMSEMVKLLFQLNNHINSCCQVGSNLMKQLDSLFTKRTLSPNKPNLDVDGVRFDIVYQSLANLAVSLVNLDEVISNQVVLKKHFVNFKRMLQLVSSQTGSDDARTSFGVAKEEMYKLKALYEVINIIELNVIDSFDDSRNGNKSFFKRLIDACSIYHQTNYDQLAPSTVIIKQNDVICEQFSSFIRSSVNEYESQLVSLSSSNYFDDRKWFSISCLYVLYVWIFYKDDRRIFKLIIDQQKKVSNLIFPASTLIIHLEGNVSIFPEIFLSAKLPQKMVDKKIIEVISSSRESLIKGAHYNALFSKEFYLISDKINNWLINFELNFGTNSVNSSESIVIRLTEQFKILEDAEQLSHQSSYLIKSSINLHVNYNKSISKSLIASICSLINILKMIQVSIERNKERILLFQSNYNQYNCCLSLNSLTQLKKRLVNDNKKYSEKKLDIISSVILTSNCFHGNVCSKERRTIISLNLNILINSMNESESSKIFKSFKNIEATSQLISSIKMNTNTEFMFFNINIIGVYFNQLSSSSNQVNYTNQVNDLKYFLFSFNDWIKLIETGLKYHSKYEEKSKIFLKNLEEKIFKIFKTKYLNNICSQFETELRLQSHSDLKLDDQSPFKRQDNLINFKLILKSEPIRLFDEKYISLREEVEKYLNEIFYNLTTITLHDWKSYESMLNVSKYRFCRDLKYVPSQLPSETINQGLDVIEISKNISSFASNYYYNLNNQMFIEKSSKFKHLNVLLISHVSNSITTHGFGIINTSINYCYQFLRKKLEIFSKILFQENIKSRLIKDLRYFKEQSLINTNYKFSYEKAEKFVKGIRKLGLNQFNESVLDQFKQLITEIGNVLSFIRILRSGSLHSSSLAVYYVPDLDDLSNVNFVKLVNDEVDVVNNQDNLVNNSQKVVIEAAENLDSILSTLNQNFSSQTDYFQLLINVFKSSLKDANHLKNFYVMVPALTISHVESLIVMKEKLMRSKTKISSAPTDGVNFTDDGFVVGVSYILSLLDQVNDFDSLQWFNSINEKITKDRSIAKEASASLASDASFANQTTGLTLKRLDVLEKEFNLLNYNLSSCKVLFRAK